MEFKIHNSWQQLINKEFNKEYFIYLTTFVKEQYKNHVCYPKESQIFAALDFCSLEKTKVVVIGQDPYHGQNQANGLCFSVNDDQSLPPSLKNIFKEINTDLGLSIPINGNLEKWSKQGVLLLNSTLTVQSKKPGSHQNKGWEIFTNSIIQEISNKKENVVFLLWGNYAQQKGSIIDASKHKVLKAPHPSPFSVYKGFYGCKHFSQTNNYLKSTNQLPINW